MVEIDRWHNGGWSGHICGLPFNDFEIEMGTSYFIKSNATSSWSIEGSPAGASSLALQIGWNAISIAHTDAYRAESLCDDIISQGVTAIEIDRWHNSGWEGHICGLPFNDFDIERGVGYFVKASSAGTVTPSAPASRQGPPRTEESISPDDLPAGPFQSIRDLRVANLRDTSVTLSWTTDEPTTGYVLYGEGENTELGQVAADVRGAQLSADTHYVTLTKLKPETRYDLKVVSGAESDRDTHLSITTLPTLSSVPASDTIYGQVYMPDGVTPATDVLVYLTLQDADGPSTSSGTGDRAEATLLSTLTDEQGYWHANLGNARLADGRLFDYSTREDKLLIEVQGSDPSTQVDTANLSPAPDIFLANIPTSITVGAFKSTLPAGSWLALLPLALTILAGTLLIWRQPKR